FWPFRFRVVAGRSPLISEFAIKPPSDSARQKSVGAKVGLAVRPIRWTFLFPPLTSLIVGVAQFGLEETCNTTVPRASSRRCGRSDSSWRAGWQKGFHSFRSCQKHFGPSWPPSEWRSRRAQGCPQG